MKLAQLENLLGYTFKSIDLLERALTHRSWAHEHLPGKSEEEIRQIENESMEFVGDSVLGLVVAEALFLKNPALHEGSLTLMKHHLVSMPTLSRVAASLNLGDFIRIGRGEEKTGGREKQAILADTLEAVIAAVFFDGGYIHARSVIARIFAREFRNATPKTSLDYKTLLQETLQAQKLPAPVYTLIRAEGRPHQREFHVEAVWNGGRAEGTGSSIKAAEMHAASRALQALKKQNSKSVKTNL